ncbi:MAG TPA: FecR domain-containing protein [Bacteroidales bacterium]|nr:FecR domain-containing protein [Bacteroidales bacterium]HQK37556.1 FecR domain-containing protein [Bacteroidales bacterium]
MNDYRLYRAEDFAQDPLFVSMVKDKSPDTERFWKQYWENHPEQKQELDLAVEMVKTFLIQEPDLNPQKQEMILKEILEHESNRRKKIFRMPVSGRWLRAAAIIAGLVLAGTFLIQRYTGNVSFSTGYGEVRKVVLPDQSEVMLNGNSRIHFARNWKEDQPREVWVEGEAFFDVRKLGDLPNKRFLVHTADLVIEVLGTRFNVDARGENTTVTLNSGQILINLPNRETDRALLMKPGEMVTYSKERKTLVRKEVAADEFSAWTQGKLIFDNNTLMEIARKIEATYGVRVKIDNRDLAQRKMRGAAPTDNIDVLLLTIEKVFDLKITRNGDEILLERK